MADKPKKPVPPPSIKGDALVWQSSGCVSLVLQQPVGNKRMRAYSQGGGSDLVRRSCGCESLVLQSVGNN